MLTIADALAFARRPRNSLAKPSATRQSGEVAVDDITSRETVKQFKWVGTRPVRPDGVPKVTGLAQYGADLAMPGMLVGRILRSPHAHARIRSIDTSKAAALPGVKAVVTSADFPEQKFEYVGPERVAQNFWHMTRNIMAREKVLYEGHAVAAVAATSKAIADEALSLIAVDYEVLPHVIDVDEAMKPDAPLLFPDMITRGVEPPPKPSNISKRVEFKLGDLEAGFAAADEIVEMSFKTAPVHQAYIEPQGCVARCDADGQGELWSSSQGHFVVRAYTAQLLGMKLGDLRVYPAEIGGAFGGKTVIYVEPVAVMLARKSGHPVKIVMSREDVFRATGPTSGCVDDREDRRQARRHDCRRRRALQVAGRRVSGLAVHEHVHVRVCALRHPECARDRLRRGVATARRSRPIARRARRSAPSRWRACSMFWRRRSAWTR